MAELADAPDLGSGIFGCGGSTPSRGTSDEAEIRPQKTSVLIFAHSQKQREYGAMVVRGLSDL